MVEDGFVLWYVFILPHLFSSHIQFIFVAVSHIWSIFFLNFDGCGYEFFLTKICLICINFHNWNVDMDVVTSICDPFMLNLSSVWWEKVEFSLIRTIFFYWFFSSGRRWTFKDINFVLIWDKAPKARNQTKDNRL